MRQKWTRDQVRAEVSRRKDRAGVLEEPEKLTAEPGRAGTYRIIKATAGPLNGQLVLDLGFANYFQAPGLDKFKEGAIVRHFEGEGPKESREILQVYDLQDDNQEDLYTYRAYVTKVLDGDTFDAVIDLGFKIFTFQKLRLRALDAPEIVSAEGREAKAFLEKHFAKTRNEILIKTSKSDKYDRYLADIWAGEVYVNQALIDEGLAVIVND